MHRTAVDLHYFPMKIIVKCEGENYNKSENQKYIFIMRVQYQYHLWSEMYKSCQKSSNNVAGCQDTCSLILKLISHGSKVSCWWTKLNT